MGEVIVAVVGEAELQDLAADVLGQGGSAVLARGGGGGGGLAAVSLDGGGGRGALVVGEPGDGVGVVVDADEDAVGGVGGPGARAEAERGEVAGLAVAASAHGVHDGGGRGSETRRDADRRWRRKVREPWLDGLGCMAVSCACRGLGFPKWPATAESCFCGLWPRPSQHSS